MPIRVITIEALSSIGNTWLGMATRPRVAMTPEMASSTGTPAATRAPKARIRMMSVTGRDSVSAFFRSLPTASSICDPTLASPNSSMRSCGLAFCTLLTAASTGSMRSPALSALPLMSNFTRAECSSLETRPAPSGSPAADTFSTTGTADTADLMLWIAAVNAGSSALRVALWISTSSWAGVGKCRSSACSAAPDCPLNSSALESLFVPTMPPITTARTTNASQPASTDFLCRALQLPIRAAIPLFRLSRNIW